MRMLRCATRNHVKTVSPISEKLVASGSYAAVKFVGHKSVTKTCDPLPQNDASVQKKKKNTMRCKLLFAILLEKKKKGRLISTL
jgi:hypothetical protein